MLGLVVIKCQVPSQWTEPMRTSKGYCARSAETTSIRSGVVVDLEADLDRQPFVLRALGEADVLLERVARVEVQYSASAALVGS